MCTLNSSGHTYEDRVCWTNEHGGDILPAQRLAYELTNDGTGVTIMMDGLYEITFNTFGSEPKIQINGETYASIFFPSKNRGVWVVKTGSFSLSFKKKKQQQLQNSGSTAVKKNELGSYVGFQITPQATTSFF